MSIRKDKKIKRKGQWILIATFILITAVNLAIGYKYTLVGGTAKTFNFNKENYLSFLSFSSSFKNLISSFAEIKRDYKASGGDFSCILLFINKTNVTVFNGFNKEIYVKILFFDKNITRTTNIPALSYKIYPLYSEKIKINSTEFCIISNSESLPWISGILIFSKDENRDVLPLNAYIC